MKRILIISSISLVISAVLFALPNTVGAWHAANENQCYRIYTCEDSFYNYDFVNSESSSWDNVDWTANLFFYDNADKEKVWDLLYGYSPWASTMYMLLDNGGGDIWDADYGTKQWASTTPHVRVYSDYDWESELYRSYNTEWGYYVVGTSHWDHNEWWFGTWYGESERTEEDAARISRDKGKAVSEDSWDWGNEEPGDRREGSHRWNNSGWATTVDVD